MAAAPAHRFVHLATHGFFADESEPSAVAVAQRAVDLLRGGLRLRAEVAGRHPGLLSGLVFAGVNQPDRRPEETILTALEASELELGKVELVVLSACDTGRGQVAGGEGVLGLAACLPARRGARRGGQPVEGARRGDAPVDARVLPPRLVGEAVVEGGGVAAGAAVDAGELERPRWPGAAGRSARSASTLRLGRFRPVGGLAVRGTALYSGLKTGCPLSGFRAPFERLHWYQE